jgi:hypothetical protein
MTLSWKNSCHSSGVRCGNCPNLSVLAPSLYLRDEKLDVPTCSDQAPQACLRLLGSVSRTDFAIFSSSSSSPSAYGSDSCASQDSFRTAALCACLPFCSVISLDFLFPQVFFCCLRGRPSVGSIGDPNLDPAEVGSSSAPSYRPI